jgi:hypothetical protein
VQCLAYEQTIQGMAATFPEARIGPRIDSIKSLTAQADVHLKEAKELQQKVPTFKSDMKAKKALEDLKELLMTAQNAQLTAQDAQLTAQGAITEALVTFSATNNSAVVPQNAKDIPSASAPQQKQTQQRVPTESSLFEQNQQRLPTESPLFEPMEPKEASSTSETALPVYSNQLLSVVERKDPPSPVSDRELQGKRRVKQPDRPGMVPVVDHVPAPTKKSHARRRSKGGNVTVVVTHQPAPNNIVDSRRKVISVVNPESVNSQPGNQHVNPQPGNPLAQAGHNKTGENRMAARGDDLLKQFQSYSQKRAIPESLRRSPAPNFAEHLARHAQAGRKNDQDRV